MLHRCLAAALVTVVMGAAHGGPVDVPVAPFHAGETTHTFHPQIEHRQRGARTQAFVTNIWYPVDISVPGVSHDVDVPGRSPFRMQPSVDKAPVASTQAQHPLLLLSHGMGSTASSLDWMAAAPTANGYIVAGVSHPGSTALEPLTRDGSMLWRERATDVSEVLNGVPANLVLGAYVDRTRIGAVGFSSDGYTVPELAGVCTDVPAFMAFCGSSQTDAICHPPEIVRAQINLAVDITRSPQTEASLTRSDASYRDTHIKAVFAMAPALGMAMDATSLGNISISVSPMIEDVDITVPVDTNVRHVAKMLPKADLLLVPGASHYMFMDTCLPGAAPHVSLLCKDNPGVDRDTVYARAVRRTLDFFGAALPDQT